MANIVRKEFLYRGKSIEELKKLDTREFAKHLPAGERRSILRHFDVVENFIKKCVKNSDKKKQIKTHNRNLVVVPKMIGYTIKIHNGKEFVGILLTDEMIGHRLGEFALTRKKVEHGAAGIGATRGSASKSVK